MAKISKYVLLNKDVLMEYVYNDGNLISDRYKIVTDTRNRSRSYVAADSSGTGNIQSNQLVNTDLAGIRWGNMNPDYYSYLQVADYASSSPLRHDTLRFHIPVNWTFGENLGFYIRVYAYDPTNTYTISLSNFYFDMTDVNQQYLMEYTTPALLFQEKMWGKSIVVDIPALGEVSKQLANGVAKPNSINYNLTGGDGLSLTAPVFIDFMFIQGIQVVNGVKTFTLGQKFTTTIPQTPEFESLGLTIQHSNNGDYFEIFGTYNDTAAGFKKFIDDSYINDRNYYVQYSITTYEQNIRGKTIVINVTDSFNEPVEYRPIIKNSTTTVIIDVEMRLIDRVDNSYIYRMASYGMLQDEVAKFSLNLTKINLDGAMKPKIYNVKNTIDYSLLGKTNSMGKSRTPRGRSGFGYKVGIATTKGQGTSGNMIDPNMVQTTVQTVNVPYAVLVDKVNIIGKSDNALINNNMFYGNGKMQIQLYPFDNILKFVIASGDSTVPDYLDMSGLGDIRIVFKNDSTVIDFPVMLEAKDVNLALGMVAFKIPQTKFQKVKKIFLSGINLFYITANNGGNTTVIYTGIFQIYDTSSNVSALNAATGGTPTINKDPNLPKATAVVTKQLVTQSTEPTKKGG